MKEIRILENKETIIALILGDWHVASYEGCFKPNSKDLYDNVVHSQTGEKTYKKLMQELPKIGKVDILYLMGDLAEGISKTIAGYPVQNVDANTVVSWTLSILDDVLKITQPEYIFAVNGTPTHVGYSSSLDRQVFDAIQIKYPKIQCFFGDDLAIKAGTKWHHLAHFYSTARNSMTPAHPLLQQMFEDVGIKRGRFYDLVIRAHIHKYQWINYRGVIVCTAPCLQNETSYWKRKGQLGHPDVGFLVIEQRKHALIPKVVIF